MLWLKILVYCDIKTLSTWEANEVFLVVEFFSSRRVLESYAVSLLRPNSHYYPWATDARDRRARMGLLRLTAMLSSADTLLWWTHSKKAPFGSLGCLACSEDTVWFREIRFQRALGLCSHLKQKRTQWTPGLWLQLEETCQENCAFKSPVKGPS